MAKTKPNGNAANTEKKVNFLVRGQFIRDMSFENFAAQKMDWPKAEVKVDTNLNVDVKPLANENFVVSVKVNLEAKAGDKGVYLLELDYAGLFLVQNIPKPQLYPFLSIQCPTILFPFIRKIIADITGDGGFPPYLMNYIDFSQLYQHQMMQMRAQSQKIRK